MSYVVKILLVVFTMSLFAKAEEITLSGIYTVPTNDKDLVQASQFKVSDYKIIEPNSVRPVIQFRLPIELTGSTEVLRFERELVINPQDKTSLFTSAQGSALCYGPWKQMKCFFKFSNLQMDSVQAIHTLSDLFDGVEFTHKLAAVRRFSSEPVGILEIAP